ncbi:MAG: RNA polymerase sigma factor [Planctomycetota bacterium]|jgi:DNA-directed RNA polymerase specialized sigma24 family protein
MDMQTVITEAEHIKASKSQDIEAFASIVSRYQALICAVTYSGTGDFPQSRDLAKETFVRAFQSLGQLRDPHRFRFMLCRIARNLVGKSVRRERFEVINGGESSLPRQADSVEIPVNPDRQALVWKAIETIPEKYREPLVFFYQRESGDSVEACQLDLAEPVLIQFVSQARSLLRPEVASMVQDILAKTAPGESFTSGVMEAISRLPAPTVETAKAAPATNTKSSMPMDYLYPSGPVPMSPGALRVAFGGCIFGGVAWLLPTSIMAKDRLSAVAVVAVAVPLFIAATTLCLRNQGKRWQILGWVVIVLCALNLAVINLRWSHWVQAYEQNPAYNSPGGLSRWTLNIIIAAIMSALLLIFITLDSRQRIRPPGAAKSEAGNSKS